MGIAFLHQRLEILLMLLPFLRYHSHLSGTKYYSSRGDLCLLWQNWRDQRLAGVRIDGKSNSRSPMSFYTGIGIHQIMDDGTLGPEKEIYGFPSGAKLNFVTWLMSFFVFGAHLHGPAYCFNMIQIFCCGIARPGVYNRTLTPFGFQNEDRTLWEAISTYINMSPFMSANKIKKPILLIHGEEDNNPVTLTMQAMVVILPFEIHGYAARESVMHVLWETDRWLQKYGVANSSEACEDQKASEENASSTIGTGGKAVGAAGRVP